MQLVKPVSVDCAARLVVAAVNVPPGKPVLVVFVHLAVELILIVQRNSLASIINVKVSKTILF